MNWRAWVPRTLRNRLVVGCLLTGVVGLLLVHLLSCTVYYEMVRWSAPAGTSELQKTTAVMIDLIGETAVLVGVVWAMLAHYQRALRTLDGLTLAAHRAESGDLAARVEVDPAQPKELVDLGYSFNTVLSRLENRALGESDARAAMLRMLSDAAHELRTPLTALHGFLQLGLAGGLAELDALTTAMQTMDGEVRRMGSLVDALLTLAGLRQGATIQRVPVDLARLCADAVVEHRRLAPDHPIEFDREAGEYMVDGDARHLRSLIGNLLANVREHTPPRHAARVSLSHGHGELILDVIDSGPGIPPEYREQVYELFFRGDVSRSRVSGHPENGAGLGLTVVAAISAAHGGTVTVREGRWHGAWLRVVLPATVARAAVRQCCTRARSTVLPEPSEGVVSPTASQPSR